MPVPLMAKSKGFAELVMAPCVIGRRTPVVWVPWPVAGELEELLLVTNCVANTYSPVL